MDKRIILEFTPEEIRLLAYGAVSGDLKKRMKEIAYHIDGEERAIATSKEKGYKKRILNSKN